MSGAGRRAPRFAHNTDIGQNFLRDLTVASWMADRADLGAEDSVLEIGAGDGALTRALLATQAGRVDAVELDTRLRPALAPLEQDARLRVHWGDALALDLSSICSPTHVIANLPYHITTPVIWRLLELFSGADMRYMLLMVQREAADRIAARPPSREASPLGTTLAAISRARLARRVPRGAFAPMPRVESAIVEIELSRARAELPRDARWRRLLAASFAHRRKTLVNCWSASLAMPREEAEAVLSSLSLPRTQRAEETPLETWLALRDDERMARYLAPGG